MGVSLRESDFKGLMRLTVNILKAPLNSLNGPQLKMTVLEVNICSFLAFMTNQTFQTSYNFSTFATWKRVAFWQWLSNISWASSYLFFLQRWFLLLKCFPEAMLMLWNSWCILFFKNWNAAILSPPIFRLLYYREELHLVSWDTLGLTLSLFTTSKLSNLLPSITPYTWSTFYSKWNCFLLPNLSVFTRVFLTPTKKETISSTTLFQRVPSLSYLPMASSLGTQRFRDKILRAKINGKSKLGGHRLQLFDIMIFIANSKHWLSNELYILLFIVYNKKALKDRSGTFL